MSKQNIVIQKTVLKWRQFIMVFCDKILNLGIQYHVQVSIIQNHFKEPELHLIQV